MMLKAQTFDLRDVENFLSKQFKTSLKFVLFELSTLQRGLWQLNHVYYALNIKAIQLWHNQDRNTFTFAFTIISPVRASWKLVSFFFVQSIFILNIPGKLPSFNYEKEEDILINVFSNPIWIEATSAFLMGWMDKCFVRFNLAQRQFCKSYQLSQNLAILVNSNILQRL